MLRETKKFGYAKCQHGSTVSQDGKMIFIWIIKLPKIIAREPMENITVTTFAYQT